MIFLTILLIFKWEYISNPLYLFIYRLRFPMHVTVWWENWEVTHLPLLGGATELKRQQEQFCAEPKNRSGEEAIGTTVLKTKPEESPIKPENIVCKILLPLHSLATYRLLLLPSQNSPFYFIFFKKSEFHSTWLQPSNHQFYRFWTHLAVFFTSFLSRRFKGSSGLDKGSDPSPFSWTGQSDPIFTRLLKIKR